MIHYLLKLFLTSVIFTFSLNSAFSQLFDGWRGVNRSGIYNESGLLKSWPAGGPAVIWEAADAGSGFSSPTVTTDAVYITGRKGERE